MPNLISKLRLNRLTSLLSNSALPGPEVDPGRLVDSESQESLAFTESLLCEGISHYLGRATEELVSQESGTNGTEAAVNAFGKPVFNLETYSPAGSVAAASGTALSGSRSAAFISGDRLLDVLPQLRQVASRHIPLVIHPILREGDPLGVGHTGYYAAGECGFFQILPSSLQQAIDWTLVARWIAERSLVPGIVAFDRHIAGTVYLPTAALVRRYLGGPDDEIESPTPAQLLLFGESRRLVVRWFDYDRPVAVSSLQGANEALAAGGGRQAFFLDHLAKLASEGAARFAELTGRALSFVEQYNLEKAEYVIAAQGGAFQTACAAADYLRKEKGLKIGVLGLTWYRPFPVSDVVALLNRKSGVLVLESSEVPLGADPPLLRQLKACVGGSVAKWMSGIYGLRGQPVSVADVAAVGEELAGKAPRPLALLGMESASRKQTPFPKRKGYLEGVASDYPAVDARAARGGQACNVYGKEVRTIQWIGKVEGPLSDALTRLTETVGEVAGPEVAATAWYPERGVISARLSGGPHEFRLVEAGSKVDLLLLGRGALDFVGNPFSDVSNGSSVIVQSDRAPEDIWNLMPSSWRNLIRSLKLNLYGIDGSFEELLPAVSALLSEAVDLPCKPIDWSDLTDPEEIEEVPVLLRRMDKFGLEYDNLSAFWGNLVQPRQEGGDDTVPDPLVTVNMVPAASAALARPRGTALAQMPVLDPEKCTGCADCLTVCPDSAIGVSVIGITELLDAASRLAGNEGKVAAAAQRAHKAVASRLTAAVLKENPRMLNADSFESAFASAAPKINVNAGDRPELEKIYRATCAKAAEVQPIITERFFRKAEDSEKGSGNLFVLTINPGNCQGCQLCIRTCPEEALAPQSRAGAVGRRSQHQWETWERLPDTSSSLIEKAALDPDFGLTRAVLLSRYCSLAQAGGRIGEPGSGERLASRLVTAAVEFEVQRQLAARSTRIKEMADTLWEMAQQSIASGLKKTDLATLEKALREIQGTRPSLGELDSRLAALGKGLAIDRLETFRLVRVAHQLEDECWRLVEGPKGYGRARFGVILTGDHASDWAARFPYHPYQAPLVVELSAHGFDLAFGVAAGMAAEHLERVRTLRRAKLLIENPSDLPGRLLEVEQLAWDALTPDEIRECPPLFLFADESSLTEQGLGELGRFLSLQMPVRILLMDGRALQNRVAEPAFAALAHRDTFVLCSSLAHVDHLTTGLQRALNYSGPAFIHIHTPVPRRHGFAPADTVERARLAVEGRCHPLFIYDPSAEGIFGTRASLAGNPAVHADWGTVDYFHWTLGERRFARLYRSAPSRDETIPVADFLSLSPEEQAGKLPVIADSEGRALVVPSEILRAGAERLHIWKIYREIAGLESPFVERIREQLTRETEAQHAEKVAELTRDYESRIAALEGDINNQMVSVLRERLLAMSGFKITQNAGGN